MCQTELLNAMLTIQERMTLYTYMYSRQTQCLHMHLYHASRMVAMFVIYRFAEILLGDITIVVAENLYIEHLVGNSRRHVEARWCNDKVSLYV